MCKAWNSCSILNCEFNDKGLCLYCGDYWELNDPDCISFIDENEGME